MENKLTTAQYIVLFIKLIETASKDVHINTGGQPSLESLTFYHTFLESVSKTSFLESIDSSDNSIDYVDDIKTNAVKYIELYKDHRENILKFIPGEMPKSFVSTEIIDGIERLCYVLKDLENVHYKANPQNQVIISDEIRQKKELLFEFQDRYNLELKEYQFTNRYFYQEIFVQCETVIKEIDAYKDMIYNSSKFENQLFESEIIGNLHALCNTRIFETTSLELFSRYINSVDKKHNLTFVKGSKIKACYVVHRLFKIIEQNLDAEKWRDNILESLDIDRDGFYLKKYNTVESGTTKNLSSLKQQIDDILQS